MVFKLEMAIYFLLYFSGPKGLKDFSLSYFLMTNGIVFQK